MSDDNQSPRRSPRLRRPHALDFSTRKKLTRTDPLVHYGRHFGRTVHIFCNIHVLITNGILRITDPDYNMESATLPPEELRENRMFKTLLKTIPTVEERIANGCSEEDLRLIADLLQKGANGARGDDTKSLKGAVLEWITPRGVPLNPPLSRNIKVDRGFFHETTGQLLCPANLDWSDPEIKSQLQSGDYVVSGDEWPMFLYKDYQYDPKNPWNGLFRSAILISAFKHIFTCPSSVEASAKTARSGNAEIHGMRRVTVAAIAYSATQLRFALSSTPTFSRTDKSTDSQRFYNTVIDWLEEPDEAEEVKDLLNFWNRQVFPEHIVGRRLVTKDSVLMKLKERRAALKELTAVQALAACQRASSARSGGRT